MGKWEIQQKMYHGGCWLPEKHLECLQSCLPNGDNVEIYPTLPTCSSYSPHSQTDHLEAEDTHAQRETESWVCTEPTSPGVAGKRGVGGNKYRV
jgi:hypothetical protein